MLISFSVENYRSFAEKQVLSMVAGTASAKKKQLSFPSGNSYAPSLLKVACIFGANGSGKTSFLNAIGFLQYMVRSSAKSQEGDKIKVKPHLLHSERRNKPSSFEIIFIHDGTLYQYGFAADQHRIWEEWLFAGPNSDNARMRQLFTRMFSPETNDYEWKLNKTHLKGDKETWKKATRANALFLSQAVQLNSDDLRKPFDWIVNKLAYLGSLDRVISDFTLEQIDQHNKKNNVLNLLQSVDIKIKDLEVESKKLKRNDLPDDMPEELGNLFLKKEAIIYQVRSLHEDNEGINIPIDFQEESDGTNVLFGLSGHWLDTLEKGLCLIVDELHNSLHPHAVKALIRLFYDPEINKNNAQLIFTSHETSILAKGFMHQDQIWLAEKGKSESTELIPLSDFKVRDVNNFQKAYLDGRYGGVPILKDFADG